VVAVIDIGAGIRTPCVPSAVPGIAFLSGRQSDEEATAHLDAMKDWQRPLEADILLRQGAAGGTAKGVVRQA
jgi:fructose-bisphosphate aldolase class 1